MDESETIKPNRKKKLLFEPVEVSIIRQCLCDWRNQQKQAEKEAAVELIGELLAMYTHNEHSQIDKSCVVMTPKLLKR